MTFASCQCSSATLAEQDHRPYRRPTARAFRWIGREIYKHACKTRLEGIICKVRHSRYTWVALTIGRDATQRGCALHGKKFESIYLGRHKGGGLLYAGKVDPPLLHCISNGLASATETADPEEASLKQVDRAPRGYGFEPLFDTGFCGSMSSSS